MKALTALTALLLALAVLHTAAFISEHLDHDRDVRIERDRLKNACGQPRTLRLPYTRNL